MFNNGNGYSLADIAAVASNGGFGDMGNGGGWWILFFLFFCCGGWGGNGFFGNGNGVNSAGVQGALTRSDLTQAFNFQDLENSVSAVRDGVTGLGSQIMGAFDGIVDNLHQGFSANSINTMNQTAELQSTLNAMNIANMQNANAANIANMQGFNAVTNAINTSNCNNQTAFAQIGYDMATNTCAINTNNCNNTRDIIDAQNAGTRAILEAIQNSKVEALQDRIADLTSQNQTLRFAASQAAQNNYLVNELRPSPVPSYIVPNPYSSYGFGCGCGCNA